MYSQLPSRKRPEFRRHTIADSCPSLIETKEWPDGESGLAVRVNPRKHWRRKTTDFSKSLQRPTWRRPQASTTLHSDNDEELGTIKTRSKRRVTHFGRIPGNLHPRTQITHFSFFSAVPPLEMPVFDSLPDPSLAFRTRAGPINSFVYACLWLTQRALYSHLDMNV